MRATGEPRGPCRDGARSGAGGGRRRRRARRRGEPRRGRVRRSRAGRASRGRGDRAALLALLQRRAVGLRRTTSCTDVRFGTVIPILTRDRPLLRVQERTAEATGTG